MEKNETKNCSRYVMPWLPHCLQQLLYYIFFHQPRSHLLLRCHMTYNNATVSRKTSLSWQLYKLCDVRGFDVYCYTRMLTFVRCYT